MDILPGATPLMAGVRQSGSAPKTLAYAAADPGWGLVCLHFAGAYEWDDPQPQPESQPVLLAVRYGDGIFSDTFTFTPTGAAYRAAAR